MAFHSFEDLEVWKRASRLAVDVCRELGTSNHFALRDQIQRAAIPIPSNIAEGSERDSPKEFVRFLRIAKGSAAELRTQIYIANRLGVLADNQSKAFVGECKEISAMLQGLIRSIQPDRH